MSLKEKSKHQINTAQALEDYALAIESREVSLIGRKEVFMGKAKFGIFGDGKEVAQLAMARFFQNGDFRSGYYRDQTFMMGIGQVTSQEIFSQLYAHTSLEHEPASVGRMMNGHCGTRSLNEKGDWKTLTDKKNSTSDLSPTAAQIPRLVGLGYASKLYRNNPALHDFQDFSITGNEVGFGMIGNASTSEGHFLESMNAIGVLQVPVVMAVWDDGYGISVPNKYHTIKESISESLAGFQRTDKDVGFEILTARGWNYLELLEVFGKAVRLSRKEHVPCLVHVEEMTQPQGHSTSGSHERYKPKDRLAWEAEYDCIKKMREWILEGELIDENGLNEIERSAKIRAKTARELAWKAYVGDNIADRDEAVDLLSNLFSESQIDKIGQRAKELKANKSPLKAEIMNAVRESLFEIRHLKSTSKTELNSWLKQKKEKYYDQYSSDIYSHSDKASLKINEVRPIYSESSTLVDGREVLQATFDHHLSTNPLVFAIGEDVGQIGDVNQGFAGLQEKHGELRVTDTGIRETSIIGQGIGAALRGLRPIAEIQYLDYLLYAIQTLSDDLSTLYHRTKGGQKAPLIVRTRGHRLEGVWHSGSPMGMIINSLRGMNILVPRDMTQAAGFYNTMLDSDDPALIIESLNGYRLKEKIPDNLSEIRTPIGIPEILKDGEDVTIVTYGSMCRMVMNVADILSEASISCEVIDVRSLLPFDVNQTIANSVKKTNKIVFVDEDVPGGATAFMMQQVLERDGGFRFLDAKPLTITGKDHRPAYGSDGDYFSKPSEIDILEGVYGVMHQDNPTKFPGTIEDL